MKGVQQVGRLRKTISISWMLATDFRLTKYVWRNKRLLLSFDKFKLPSIPALDRLRWQTLFISYVRQYFIVSTRVSLAMTFGASEPGNSGDGATVGGSLLPRAD